MKISNDQIALNARQNDPAVHQIVSRTVKGGKTLVRLSSGARFTARRFFPAGEGDLLRLEGDSIEVYAKNDRAWIEIGRPWVFEKVSQFAGASTVLKFKEIETDRELQLFEDLRKFHYRGGGGAGRTVPLIVTSDLWDLPTLLGFVEVSSSMIANSARKRFLDFPYSETEGPRWMSWDRAATKHYSNIICRISRFVIHPEVRGLGLAKYFCEAVRAFANERWHYGGFKPRFVEITADMLRYYKFLDQRFVLMGHTEGNEHRVTKDMKYLVGKGLSVEGPKSMPQGGGGIMTLQRGYAAQLMKYMRQNDKSLVDMIDTLKFDVARLDQETWEALHKINRRPKPTYTAGITIEAERYVETRRQMLEVPSALPTPQQVVGKTWTVDNVLIEVATGMAQSSEARLLQDAFGFVGSSLKTKIVDDLSFAVVRNAVTLVCGASGSGKTVLLSIVGELFDATSSDAISSETINIRGSASGHPHVIYLEPLPDQAYPIELKGRASLEDFLTVTAKCGLAEPQLLVRPVASLSSGQRYRLQVALAVLKKPDILIIDNFCEPLDRYTALAVIKGIQRLAQERSFAVLAATASYDRLLDLFTPDQTILLRRGDSPVVTQSRR